MKDVQRQLLRCMNAYRFGKHAQIELDTSDPAVWKSLYNQAAVHKMEGIVFETLRHDPTFCGGGHSLCGRQGRGVPWLVPSTGAASLRR